MAGLAIFYMLAALLGACIPNNRLFHSAPGGIAIQVDCSEIHTDLIVPLKNELFDWSSLLPEPRLVGNYAWLAIGWGDRTFYLETPTWGDLKVSNVVGAACGMHPTAMHVEWLQNSLPDGPKSRSLTLSGPQYQHLCEFLSASFKRDSTGQVVLIKAPGYIPTDAFYEAQGHHYSAFETCNCWAGQGLDAAGVRVGIWTPFPWGVLWQLEGTP